MNEEIMFGLDANTGTALVVLATGVIVPAVTSLLSRPSTPSAVKRWLPIGLAVAAALLITLLQQGGPLAEQLIKWLLLAASVTGIAQAVFSLMPEQWRKLSAATDRAVQPRGSDGRPE